MSKILKLLFIVVATTFFVFGANAKEERTHGSLCTTRVPKIEINGAIEIAVKAFSKLQATDSSYIDSISLECKEKKQYWIVGFRRRAYETGHLLIYIYMDGTTEISVEKDG